MGCAVLEQEGSLSERYLVFTDLGGFNLRWGSQFRLNTAHFPLVSYLFVLEKETRQWSQWKQTMRWRVELLPFSWL